MVTTLLQQKFGYLFDADLLEEIANVSILKKYDEGQVIIEIGQELKSIPLLLQGNIKILREDEHGNEFLLYVLESGDTCAMSLTCCMGSSKSKIRAVADMDTQLIMIPIDKMQQWFESNSSWRNFILQSYQIRFNEMLETIDTLAFMKMDERLHKYLIDKVKLNASTTIEKTHQQIAEDLNTSRVVISRLLKQLEKDHQIKLSRNKIEVLNF